MLVCSNCIPMLENNPTTDPAGAVNRSVDERSKILQGYKSLLRLGSYVTRFD